MTRQFTLDSKKILELATSAVTSSLNFLRIRSVESGNPVEIETDGIDTDVDLNLKTKGAGQLLVNGVPISGVPGGSTLQFQYNNAGTFAGDANLTTNGLGITAMGFLRGDNIMLDGNDISSIGPSGTMTNFTIDGGSF